MSSTRSNRRAAGFTLLELLVVISILAVAAFVAVSGLEEDDGQWRLDETRNRIERIRTAIVGDPDLRANGGPVVSGFIVDVGVPPPCLEALITNDGSCGAAAGDTYPRYSVNSDGMGAGWRGPYLSVAVESVTGLAAIRDGWGNTDGGAGADNFGWAVFTYDEAGDGSISIQSLGADLAADPATAADYDALDFYSRDYPPSSAGDPGNPDPIIVAEDYLVDMSTVQVSLWNGTSIDVVIDPAINLCFRFTYPTAADSFTTVESVQEISGTFPALSSTSVEFSLTDGASNPLQVPWGVRAWQLFESTDGTTCSTVAFVDHTPQLVTLLPRGALPDFDWTALHASATAVEATGTGTGTGTETGTGGGTETGTGTGTGTGGGT